MQTVVALGSDSRQTGLDWVAIAEFVAGSQGSGIALGSKPSFW